MNDGFAEPGVIEFLSSFGLYAEVLGNGFVFKAA
jgi:hypothetical protein